MIDASYLDQLKRFHLIVNKRVTSKYIGPRRSMASGRGLSFKDYRIYAPGDEIRLIDWKVYARTDDLYIKNYEEERNLTVHVLLDSSSSMNFGKPTKFEYAAMVGLGFAYLALRENEKIQFATFDDKLKVFSSKRGAGQILNMVSHFNSVKPKGDSKLHTSLKEYKRVIGSRALVVVLSDFLLPIEEIRDGLSMLRGNEVRVIQTLDYGEKNLSIQGDVKLEDSESHDKLRTYISPSLRAQYQQQLDDHRAQIEEACGQLGFDYHLVTTNKPIFDSFYEVLGK